MSYLSLGSIGGSVSLLLLFGSRPPTAQQGAQAPDSPWYWLER